MRLSRLSAVAFTERWWCRDPLHVVWGEGTRYCEEMARSADLLVPTGSLPCGPACVPSRAHPDSMGSVTYRTQVVHEPEAVPLPPGVSCGLIPAGIASFPCLGAGVHFISCVHTLPLSVLLFALPVCTLTAHSLQTHRIRFHPWDTFALPELHLSLSQRQCILHVSH